MFKCRLAQFVCYLKETLIPIKDQQPLEFKGYGHVVKKGIRVQLDLSLNNYSNDKNRRAVAHFILCGGTNVFATLDGFVSFRGLKLSAFSNISNHDSCWRDAIDRFLSDIYFAWTDEIRGDKAPEDLDSVCYLGLFTKHEIVKVEYKSKQDDDDRYELVSIEPWREEDTQ
jgi:hypothetical protein